MSVNTTPALPQAILDLVPTAQKAYVALMIDVIARALVSASKVDDEVKGELSDLAPGFVIQMMVLPRGASFYVQVQADKTLKRLASIEGKPDLSVKFKHVNHAFLVFSFQESTPRAFANDRIIVDGDVSVAIRFVRILNKVEVLILPRLIADFAVKRYPSDLGLGEKAKKAAQIYLGVASTYADLLPKAAQLLASLSNSSAPTSKTAKRS
jgi:hypothetical protein